MGKKKYSLLSNVMFAAKGLWKMSKSAAIFTAFAIILNVAEPFTKMLMPKLVVDQLEKRSSITEFLFVVGGMALLIVVVQFLHGNAFSRTLSDCSMYFLQYINVLTTDKEMDMDYELLENPEVISLHDKARNVTRKFVGLGDGSSASANSTDLLPRVVNLVVGILGLILYGGIITAVHPLILVFLLISFGIGYFVLKRVNAFEESTRVERGKLDKKLKYMTGINGSNGAKDIRLYSMSAWLKNMTDSLLNKVKEQEWNIAKRGMTASLVERALILLRDSFAYAYLVYLVLNGKITVGNFLLIFAAIGQFSNWINNILQASMNLKRTSSALSDVRAFLDLKNRTIRERGESLSKAGSMPPEFRLNNVSYTYPNNNESTIRDINLHIRSGERIAVVGINGAGKTTLVKLICGLYKNYNGEIRINNIDIDTINLGDHFDLVSPVFQDIHLMTVSVAENVSQAKDEDTDYDKVRECLAMAGLWDRVNALPEKEKTLMVKSVNENAVELSGGEMQKLALARALYKNAPVLILDEPTAALDPIAENEIYQQYAKLTEGKTSIFISHRLASTRFCDRILFMEDHIIKEMGTHDELMELGGSYAKMFSMQASYYKTESKVS